MHPLRIGYFCSRYTSVTCFASSCHFPCGIPGHFSSKFQVFSESGPISIRAWTSRSKLHFFPRPADIALYLLSVAVKKSEFCASFPSRELDEDKFLEDNVAHLLLDLVESIHQSQARIVRVSAKKYLECGLNRFSINSSLQILSIARDSHSIFWWIWCQAHSSLEFPCTKQNLRTRELLPRASSTLLRRRDELSQRSMVFSRSEMKHQPARVFLRFLEEDPLSCEQLNSQLLNCSNVKWLSRAQPGCNTWRVLRLHIWSTFSFCVITWDIACGSPKGEQ